MRDLLTQDPTALGPSVLATQRLVVQPDSTVQVPLDRPELGKYLVIVAGFYKMDVNGGSRVIPVPGVYSGPEGIKRFYPANIMTTLNPFADQAAAGAGNGSPGYVSGRARHRQREDYGAVSGGPTAAPAPEGRTT